MGLVTRLPGTGCAFFQRGRCLYEERLNPGYHDRFRCVILQGWESAYEDFLRQAEAFGLEESSASGLWQRRFERLAGAEPRCPEFQSSRDDELPGCVFAQEGLCLLALPLCEGQCPRFVARAPDPAESSAKE
jgi:hypothetical protein